MRSRSRACPAARLCGPTSHPTPPIVHTVLAPAARSVSCRREPLLRTWFLCFQNHKKKGQSLRANPAFSKTKGEGVRAGLSPRRRQGPSALWSLLLDRVLISFLSPKVCRVCCCSVPWPVGLEPKYSKHAQHALKVVVCRRRVQIGTRMKPIIVCLATHARMLNLSVRFSTYAWAQCPIHLSAHCGCCAVLGSMSVPVPGMKIPAVPRHQAVVERHFDDPATAADDVRASRINAVAATHVARHR